MMKRAQNYTIDQIAEAAGVSKATVSRVMNGTAVVSEEKRKIVEATIKKMKFHPNQNARKLAGGSGGSIALVLEESAEELFLNPFWRSVVQGFIEKASSEQLHPVLYFHSKNEPDDRLVEALVRGNYDAVAIFGWHRPIKTLEKYVPQNMIIVFGGNQGTSSRFTYVGVDNVLGGKLATEHLISVGCRKILTITGDLSVQSARERVAGYKQALAEAGIAIKESRILEGDYTQVTAERVIAACIKKGTAFDGIFAGNDVMALGVINVLQEHGFRVPEDVKVIGFDGTDITKTSNPTITTVAQPSYVLGSTVAQNLMLALNRKEITNQQLELQLVKGEST